MSEQLTNLLHAVQCLQSFYCVYTIAPTVRLQNKLRNAAGEAIFSIENTAKLLGDRPRPHWGSLQCSADSLVGGEVLTAPRQERPLGPCQPNFLLSPALPDTLRHHCLTTLASSSKGDKVHELPCNGPGCVCGIFFFL